MVNDSSEHALCTVEEIMTKNPVSVDILSSIQAAVDLMIDKDIRPLMQKVLEFVERLCLELAHVMGVLDELGHHTVSTMTGFSVKLATSLETFKLQMAELKVKHLGDIDECTRTLKNWTAKITGQP